MNKLKNVLLLVIFLAVSVKSLPQNSIKIDGVFEWKEDQRVKLVISNWRFAYIDSRPYGHLATPCCDTITYGDIKPDSNGYILLMSDRSLNEMFISMNVVEKRDEKSDSITFVIHNPIEQEFHRDNPNGGDLIYRLLVEPDKREYQYFKGIDRPFEGGCLKFYNPEMVGIKSFMIDIRPKCSVFVKNLCVRELNTLEYEVKDKNANYFEIDIPQLSYGFISYKRIDGDFAKTVGFNRIIWSGKFVKKGI